MISNVDIALTVFFVIFVVIDLFINVVLGLAIHRKKSLQTPMNLLIFHLAIADILIGVFVVPRHILNYAITYPNDTSSDYICKLITGGNFIWTSVTASSGFLTIIALERLFAVVFPHKARLRITKRRLKWLVGACWLASFAFNLPSLLVLKYDHKAQFCLEFWPEWVNPKAYVGLAFFAGNFSVIAMYILYSMILYSLWKTRKAVSEVSRTARINARKRVTKMLILMTFFHTLCRTPNYTFYMLIYFDPDAKYGSSVYSFTVFLILLNSASHPFFYCWYMDNLRRQVFAILPPIFSGHCPARLRTFNLVSSADETAVSGTVNEESRLKLKGEKVVHSYTVGSESEEEVKKSKIKLKKYKGHGKVNREIDISENSGTQSGRATPIIAHKKLDPPLNTSSDCGDTKICQDTTRLVNEERNESENPSNSGTVSVEAQRNTLNTDLISLSQNSEEEHKIVEDESKCQEDEVDDNESKEKNDENQNRDEQSSTKEDENINPDENETREQQGGDKPHDIKDIILETDSVDV